MHELIRTNDAVLVSAVVALLESGGINSLVFDQNMSVLEGSLGVLPRRVLVAEGQELRARQLLKDAGLGHELRPDESETETSEDAILGGRLRLRQPLHGHRFGHDAVLLAAATRACGGEHAVDLGSGVGAAGLALAVRVPELTVTLVELDRMLSQLASDNARLNHLDGRVRTLALDVENLAALQAAGILAG